MSTFTLYQNTELHTICESLFQAAVCIYKELKAGAGLSFLETTNHSNDEQIALDVFADACFHKHIEAQTNVKYILSEEQPNFVKHGEGKYSLTLDPLDGSKSALVGIPSGAIFGLFEQAETITDFVGKNIVCGGFFVFGINLEVYFSIHQQTVKGSWDELSQSWHFVDLPSIQACKMFAINASNQAKWDVPLQEFYKELTQVADENGKTFNMRWYASMVSEVKRLILQGGLFAYPRDSRTGYENGHLRLVYEAIPMAYLIKSIGGASSDGQQSILTKPVQELHEKTPVFLGEKALIERVESIYK